MSWTKRQLISQAFEIIGLADYVFDLEPEQWMSACRQMDAMVASWAGGLCVRIGYPLSTSPNTTNLGDDTGVPDYANEAIYLNLAVKLALSVGKALSPDLRIEAKNAYLNLLSANALSPPTMQMPSTLPLGAGQKPWRLDNPFFSPPSPSIAVGGDSELSFK